MIFSSFIADFYDFLFEIMKFILIFGIPIFLFCFGVFFLVKIFFMPAFRSGRKRQERRDEARVIGKRDEVLMNQSGLITLYYVTFDIGNDLLELMVPKEEYKRLNYGDKGILAHTGDRFERFDVTVKSTEETKGQSEIVGSTMRSSLNEILQNKKE